MSENLHIRHEIIIVTCTKIQLSISGKKENKEVNPCKMQSLFPGIIIRNCCDNTAGIHEGLNRMKMKYFEGELRREFLE